MENGGIYRSGPKPERIKIFFNKVNSDGFDSCIDMANRWLEEKGIFVDILFRATGLDGEGCPATVVIWYRER